MPRELKQKKKNTTENAVFKQAFSKWSVMLHCAEMLGEMINKSMQNVDIFVFLAQQFHYCNGQKRKNKIL